jgi:hypothetical protein
MTKCRTNLFILWLICSVVLVTIMWLQIAFGHYGDKGRQAIEWVLPTISPTLALVVGVWAKDALGSKAATVYVKKDIYRVSLIVSVGYFIFILLAILLQPFVALEPLDFLTESNLVLGLLQGVVTAVIGIFFVQKVES